MYSFKELGPAELRALLQTPEAKRIRLFDVRSPAEAQRGAIPGAENVPLHVLPLREGEWRSTEDEGDDTLRIFYCQSGGRSAQACALLSARGHRNVCNLRGGIMGWIESGGAVSL
ncbi:rhodanese-like domain-containing protein [Ectothiorhodospiraceae bacterium 2226]|nr:rhodanese-like domain-containing protein [Ectothiorhodospiraceae bacterium 2226]